MPDGTCQNVESQPGVRVFVVNWSPASTVQFFVPSHDPGQIWDNSNSEDLVWVTGQIGGYHWMHISLHINIKCNYEGSEAVASSRSFPRLHVLSVAQHSRGRASGS